jgi:hypothetical protein
MANAPKPSYRHVYPNASIDEEKNPIFRASNKQGFQCNETRTANQQQREERVRETDIGVSILLRYHFENEHSSYHHA